MKPIPQATCDRIKFHRNLGRTLEETAAIVGVSAAGVSLVERRGYREGMSGTPSKSLPDDYRIQCDAMKVKDLCRHYGVSQQTVMRWNAMAGRKPMLRHLNGCQFQPLAVPPRAELAETIDRLGVLGAKDHYGVHPHTLLRWRKRYGLPIATNKGPRAARDRREAEQAKARKTSWVDQIREMRP